MSALHSVYYDFGHNYEWSSPQIVGMEAISGIVHNLKWVC